MYSAICGYTEGDLDTVFAPELAGLDRERVREWYNGYSWLGSDKVVQPLRRAAASAPPQVRRPLVRDGHARVTGGGRCSNAASPSVSLGDTVSTEDLLSAFDVGRIGTEALLFQAGYLTITGEERLGEEALYRLGYPNREVRQSLKPGAAAAPGAERRAADGQQHPPDAAACRARLRRHEGGVPCVLREHPLRMAHEQPTSRTTRATTRACFYSYFAALGYEIVVEESSSHGRLDMAVRTGGARVSVRVQGGGDDAPRARRSHSYGNSDTRTSIAAGASRSI